MMTTGGSNNEKRGGDVGDDEGVGRIPPATLDDMMRTLNETDDMSQFIRGIRRAFVDSL